MAATDSSPAVTLSRTTDSPRMLVVLWPSTVGRVGSTVSRMIASAFFSLIACGWFGWHHENMCTTALLKSLTYMNRGDLVLEGDPVVLVGCLDKLRLKCACDELCLVCLTHDHLSYSLREAETLRPQNKVKGRLFYRAM